MKFTDYPQGNPCWVDLGTSDLEAAKSFYAELFGWQPMVSPDPAYGGYTTCHLGPDAVAGIGSTMSPEQPVAWTTYFAADNTDAIVAAVRSAGGGVIAEPFDIGTQGRMAIAADPTGAVFGIWQKIDFPGAQVANDPDTWGWSELRSTDAAAAITFYEDVFGVASATSAISGMPYTTLQVGEKGVAGVMNMAGLFPPGTPSHWHVYFAVADADATAAKAQQLGATVLAPAMDVEGVGRWIALQDPQGAAFSVMST
jgi:uncharacterized protein